MRITKEAYEVLKQIKNELKTEGMNTFEFLKLIIKEKGNITQLSAHNQARVKELYKDLQEMNPGDLNNINWNTEEIISVNKNKICRLDKSNPDRAEDPEAPSSWKPFIAQSVSPLLQIVPFTEEEEKGNKVNKQFHLDLVPFSPTDAGQKDKCLMTFDVRVPALAGNDLRLYLNEISAQIEDRCKNENMANIRASVTVPFTGKSRIAIEVTNDENLQATLERVHAVVKDMKVPVIVQGLEDSSLKDIKSFNEGAAALGRKDFIEEVKCEKRGSNYELTIIITANNLREVVKAKMKEKLQKELGKGKVEITEEKVNPNFDENKIKINLSLMELADSDKLEKQIAKFLPGSKAYEKINSTFIDFRKNNKNAIDAERKRQTVKLRDADDEDDEEREATEVPNFVLDDKVKVTATPNKQEIRIHLREPLQDIAKMQLRIPGIDVIFSKEPENYYCAFKQKREFYKTDISAIIDVLKKSGNLFDEKKKEQKINAIEMAMYALPIQLAKPSAEERKSVIKVKGRADALGQILKLKTAADVPEMKSEPTVVPVSPEQQEVDVPEALGASEVSGGIEVPKAPPLAPPLASPSQPVLMAPSMTDTKDIEAATRRLEQLRIKAEEEERQAARIKAEALKAAEREREEKKRVEDEAKKEDEKKRAEEAKKVELQRIQALEEEKRVEQEKIKAQEKEKKAEQDRLKAQEVEKKLEQERLKAQEKEKKAEQDRIKAQEEEKKAEQQRIKVQEEQKAERERIKAQEDAQKAEQARIKDQEEKESKRLEEEEKWEEFVASAQAQRWESKAIATDQKRSEEVLDIREYPTIDKDIDPDQQLTIGDTHGNVLKDIYFLVKHGVMTLKNGETDYKELVAMYEKYCITTAQFALNVPKKLSRDDFKLFEEIIKEATINAHSPNHIRYGGDKKADRGANVVFNLILDDKLNNYGKVEFNNRDKEVETLFSNHDVEFLEALASKDVDSFISYESTMDHNAQVNSLKALQMFVRDNPDLLSFEKVKEIANRSYKKTLRALSYTLSEDKSEITLYTHAPVGLEVLPHLARRLGVEYKDDTALSLAKTIDQINKKFQEDYVQTDKIRELYDPGPGKKEGVSYKEDKSNRPETQPFTLLMWYRENYGYGFEAQRPAVHNNYKVNYVHGHDGDPGSKPGQEHIYTINNILGKLSIYKETYNVVKSKGTTNRLVLDAKKVEEPKGKPQEQPVPPASVAKPIPSVPSAGGNIPKVQVPGPQRNPPAQPVPSASVAQPLEIKSVYLAENNIPKMQMKGLAVGMTNDEVAVLQMIASPYGLTITPIREAKSSGLIFSSNIREAESEFGKRLESFSGDLKRNQFNLIPGLDLPEELSKCAKSLLPAINEQAKLEFSLADIPILDQGPSMPRPSALGGGSGFFKSSSSSSSKGGTSELRGYYCSRNGEGKVDSLRFILASPGTSVSDANKSLAKQWLNTQMAKTSEQLTKAAQDSKWPDFPPNYPLLKGNQVMASLYSFPGIADKGISVNYGLIESVQVSPQNPAQARVSLELISEDKANDEDNFADLLYAAARIMEIMKDRRGDLSNLNINVKPSQSGELNLQQLALLVTCYHTTPTESVADRTRFKAEIDNCIDKWPQLLTILQSTKDNFLINTRGIIKAAQKDARQEKTNLKEQAKPSLLSTLFSKKEKAPEESGSIFNISSAHRKPPKGGGVG